MSFIRGGLMVLVLSAGLTFSGSAFAAPTEAEFEAALATYKTSLRTALTERTTIAEAQRQRGEEIAKLEDAAKKESETAALTAAVAEAQGTYVKAREAALAKFVEVAPLKELTLEQIRKLAAERVAIPTASAKAELHARLVELAKADDANGLSAGMLALDYLPTTTPATPETRKADRVARAQALAEIARHPAFMSEARGDAGKKFVQQISQLDGEDLKGLEVWDAVEAAIPQDATYTDAMASVGLVDLAADPDAGVPKERLQSIRTKAIAAVESAKAKVEASDVANPDEKKATAAAELKARQLKGIESRLGYLNGAFARGELLGHKAPALTFDWSSSETKFASLEDFKGKVVVLDFWATWCGPCIASFPHLRELRERYEGYPVEIIGVTRLQGSHHPRKLGSNARVEPISTANDPEREKSLMSEFIKDMDVTWTVAFTTPAGFNEFGITSIPHVVIIDPNGVVRHRGLNPNIDGDKQPEYIDGLLKEFKLPTPPATGEGHTPAAPKQGT